MRKILPILFCLFIVSQIEVSAQKNFKTLDYLYEISGKKTAAGQHNREPNAEPDKWTNAIYKTTGVYPKLWSGDFLFQKENIENRWQMIFEAERQWNRGAIINIMWHSCSPYFEEPCGWRDAGVLSPMSDEQWEQLITPGTLPNTTFYKRLDELAIYLDYLKLKGVEVMFRPFHEMNQGLFWWGGRPGPRGTSEIFRMAHDYFTKEKNLDNLIWIWNVQDLSFDWAGYNPGDEYWDVMTLDVYEEIGFTDKNYQLMLEIAGDKPIGIGESSRLPTAELLKKQPRWTFFMAWAELVYRDNSEEEIRALYHAPNVDVIRNF
jgi:mannan endo-1,4-beta-mannosidase